MIFDTVLIANRGEIACRIIETARAMGLKTVSVYSDVDTNARHVAMADHSLHIGGSESAQSYLSTDAILRAAEISGAGAIHPGYGFLSENPDFVETVNKAGLVFVGPSSKAIRDMGLKDAAKRVMAQAGVPVVPGYHGTDQDEDLLANHANKIGFPVLIKAVAGGGGKGMRIVSQASDFARELSSARAEAKAAFGNENVLIEKLVQKPRHIEFQIFGDGKQAVHLFERDCSLQRRHQKVIEEAPAPGMTTEMRDAMGEAAVRAALAVQYSGAGTVEFIADASEGLRPDRFWFMEMNTRLQVEHPVTEMITGVDLVEWQLRVASGESLPRVQNELTIDGHAIEARIYAEDPENGFLPATGKLKHLKFPEIARIDTGVRTGDVISHYYDPMIAKITVHGRDRGAALAKIDQALAETEVAGTVTNVEFLHRLVSISSFKLGDVDTGVISREGEALAASPQMDDAALAVACVATLGLKGGSRQGFTLWEPLNIHMQLEDSELIISPTLVGGDVRIGGQNFQVTCDDSDRWSVAGLSWHYRVFASELSATVFGPGGGRVKLSDPLARETENNAAGLSCAPMPGKVTDVPVKPGSVVKEGETLAVLEAMKMEHRLTAARDGEVAEVLAEVGAQVEAGAPLVRLVEEDR